MARHRFRVRSVFADTILERRDLLSQASAVVVHLAGPPAPGRLPDLFHRNGIDGFQLHKSFVNGMNDRLTNASDMSKRVFEAFTVFRQAYFDQPASPPLGNPAMPPTLPSLLADLNQELALALSTIELGSNQVRPSAAKAPKFSPVAFQALVPFAVQQTQQMANVLASLPPHGGGSASPTRAQATSAIDAAYSAILNALAEYSLHPNLFQSPGNYYINPAVSFPTDVSVNPARQGPGYFVRGPQGVILPGAGLHPHIPTGPLGR